jgi:hypothetical protein
LAWLWLSTVTDNPDDQRICLENVLTINPSSALARDRLAALSSDGSLPQDASSVSIDAAADSRPPVPLSLWPVVAFWASVSLLFIGGGTASLFQFAGILMRARGVLQSLSYIELAWLPMALFFVLFGVVGISLAWQLAQLRPGGYYGSLLFGLLLMVLGPSASLVLEPPDYPATVCLGLMPAAVVMLTLASMTGFETRASTYDHSVA